MFEIQWWCAGLGRHWKTRQKSRIFRCLVSATWLRAGWRLAVCIAGFAIPIQWAAINAHFIISSWNCISCVSSVGCIMPGSTRSCAPHASMYAMHPLPRQFMRQRTMNCANASVIHAPGIFYYYEMAWLGYPYPYELCERTCLLCSISFFCVSALTFPVALAATGWAPFARRWIVYRTNSWGYLKNGTFDGMIGALVRKEIDVGGSPIFFRLERAKAVDFTARTWVARWVNCKSTQYTYTQNTHTYIHRVNINDRN